MIRFIVITIVVAVGQGLGAWNIRTISSGRYKATAILTFLAATINISVIREVAREVQSFYIVAYSVGSVIGILGSIALDRKFFHRDFDEKGRDSVI